MPEITYGKVREYAEANDKLMLELLNKCYIEGPTLEPQKTFIREPDEVINEKLSKLEKVSSKIKGSKTGNDEWKKLCEQLINYTILKGSVAAEAHKHSAYKSLANQVYFVNITKGAGNIKVDFYAEETKSKIIATGEIVAVLKDIDVTIIKVKERFPDKAGTPREALEKAKPQKPKKIDMRGGADGKFDRFTMFNEITKMYKNDAPAYITSTLMNYMKKNVPTLFKTSSALMTGCPEVDCYTLTDPYARETALDVTKAECSYLIPDNVLSEWYDSVQADQDYSKVFDKHMENMNSNKAINKSALNAYRLYLEQRPANPKFSNTNKIEYDKINAYNTATFKYLNDFYDSVSVNNKIPGSSDHMFNSQIFDSLQESFDTKSLKNMLVWRDSMLAVYHNNACSDFETWNNIVQTAMPGMHKDTEIANNIASNKYDISHVALGVHDKMLPFIRVDYDDAMKSLAENRNIANKFSEAHFEYRGSNVNRSNYSVFAKANDNSYLQVADELEDYREEIIEPEAPLDDVVQTNSKKVEISLKEERKEDEEIEF